MEKVYEIPKEVTIGVLSTLLYIELDEYEANQDIKLAAKRLSKKLKPITDEYYRKIGIDPENEKFNSNMMNYFHDGITERLSRVED